MTVLSTIKTIRVQKKHAFVKLGDGSTADELQVVLPSSQAQGLAYGAAVKIDGSIRPCPPGKLQTHELDADKVALIGASHAETYPLQKKYQTKEYLRTLPHLRSRLTWNGLLRRLRSEVKWSCSQWFHEKGFLDVDPPIITSSDCEGAGEVFTVSPAVGDLEGLQASLDGAVDHGLGRSVEPPFFPSPKYLTVSSQLHLEADIHTSQKVWTLNPAFRAERSDTPRHLSEFWMLEAEIQSDSLEEVMAVVENLFRHFGASLL